MGEVYHVINRGLDSMVVYPTTTDYSRMLTAMRYYLPQRTPGKLSDYLRDHGYMRPPSLEVDGSKRLVNIVAYCLMPTHIHLLLEELLLGGVSLYMSKVLNSCTRYYNIKNKRKGTLWVGRSLKVKVDTEDQLLHVSRYIHLNPVTDYLTDQPSDWPATSYNEYADPSPSEHNICRFKHLINLESDYYAKFVKLGIADQRQMAKAKANARTS